MQGQKLFFILHNTSQFMNWTAIPNELYFTRGNFHPWNVLTIPESNTSKNITGRWCYFPSTIRSTPASVPSLSLKTDMVLTHDQKTGDRLRLLPRLPLFHRSIV